MRSLRRLAAPLACSLTAMLAGSAAAPAGTPATAKPSSHRRCRAAVHARHGGARSHTACRHAGHHSSPAKKSPATTTPVPPAGGGSGSAPAPGQTPPGGPAQATPPSGPPVVPHVQITAVEFRFTLSRSSVPHGKVIFQFVNNGQDEHNVNLQPSEGTPAGSFANTPSKGVVSQTIEMRPGSYTLFCSLPEHEQKGMKATLTVE
jgi:plastocyanin